MINLKKENGTSLLNLLKLVCIMLMGEEYLLVISHTTPGEGQIPVSFTLEPIWQLLLQVQVLFLKGSSARRNHFNEEREIPITLS